MKRPSAVILALALLAGLGTGCQTLTGRSLGTNIDDRATTAAVKTRLSTRDVRHLTRVDVDTNSGVVYLTGIVASAAEKQRAEEVARTTKGVRQVVSHLQVAGATGATAEAAPAASPATDALAGRQRLIGEVAKLDRDSGRISVRMTDGDLTLQLPPASVAGLSEGDRVTVDVAIAPAR